MPLPLRPNACLLIVNRDKRLFLAERARCPGIWQFPQGGIEPGMTAEATALKEAHEELGVPSDRFRVVKQLKAVNEYEFETPPRYAVNKWRGQSQTFWVLEYLGRDEEIQLDRYGAELMDWRWCTVEEVRRLAEPKRLRGYEAALREFVSLPEW